MMENIEKYTYTVDYTQEELMQRSDTGLANHIGEMDMQQKLLNC